MCTREELDVLKVLRENGGSYRSSSILFTEVVKLNKDYFNNQKKIHDAIENCFKNGWINIPDSPTGYMKDQVFLTDLGREFL